MAAHRYKMLGIDEDGAVHTIPSVNASMLFYVAQSTQPIYTDVARSCIQNITSFGTFKCECEYN